MKSLKMWSVFQILIRETFDQTPKDFEFFFFEKIAVYNKENNIALNILNILKQI